MLGSKEGHSTQSHGTLAWLVGGLAGMAVFLLIALSSGWAQSGVNTASALPLPARPTGTHSKPPPPPPTTPTVTVTDASSAPASTPTTLPEGPVPPTGSVVFPQPSQSQPEPTRVHQRPTPAPHPPIPDVRIPKSAVQQYARALIGSDAEFACMAHIIDHESGWDPHAGNADGSYGVPQALPGDKMSSAGADWRDNPLTQVRWMVGYLHNRYGSACNAWGFWQNHSWY